MRVAIWYWLRVVQMLILRSFGENLAFSIIGNMILDLYNFGRLLIKSSFLICIMIVLDGLSIK